MAIVTVTLSKKSLATVVVTVPDGMALRNLRAHLYREVFRQIVQDLDLASWEEDFDLETLAVEELRQENPAEYVHNPPADIATLLQMCEATWEKKQHQCAELRQKLQRK